MAKALAAALNADRSDEAGARAPCGCGGTAHRVGRGA